MVMRAFKPIWHRSQGDGERRSMVRKHSAQVLNFLGRLPYNARSVFTERQLDLMDAALSDGEVAQPSDAPRKRLHWRLRFALLGYAYSASLLVVRERRSTLPTGRRTRWHDWRKPLTHAAVATSGAMVVTCVLLVGGYALKSALGIDLFPGPSVLHGLVF